MDNDVQLSADGFRKIYKRSFRTWSALRHAATEQSGLPPSYLDIQDAFREHPSFPRDLGLKHVKYAKNSQAYATGCSTWASTPPDCEHGLPPFHQQVQIGVASRKPISLSIADTPGIRWKSWFLQGDQNYLAVLILAWTYILSARWVEIMPEGVCTSLVYTSSKADDYTPDSQSTPLQNHLSLPVDMKDAGPEEARWWAAVLAPCQGWQATMLMGEDNFVAPWSILLQPGYRFMLSTNSTFRTHSAAAPSSSEALYFLADFCVRRNIADQSQAALTAVLLFPSMRTDQGLQLPAFTATSAIQQQQHSDPDRKQRHSYHPQQDHLDKLITLSCHTKGIRPMLLSPFYEPIIPCNAATPWLQGALAVTDTFTQEDDGPLTLARMLMDRQPKAAPLWLGITVLGLQQTLLQAVRFGQIPVDLHSAAWSGAVQSFIQQPVSDPLLAADGWVARADQCRLLFLSRAGSHDRVPVCQWKPFGGTPLEHVDIEVRVHAECKGHGLRYRGFAWDCVDGRESYQVGDGDGDGGSACRSPSLPRRAPGLEQDLVDYRNLDSERDFVSENATRSIFGWLRVNGYALDEKDIWNHEWFDMSESDEEIEQGEDSSKDMPQPHS